MNFKHCHRNRRRGTRTTMVTQFLVYLLHVRYTEFYYYYYCYFLFFFLFSGIYNAVKPNELCNFEWRRDSYVCECVWKKNCHAKQRRTGKRSKGFFFLYIPNRETLCEHGNYWFGCYPDGFLQYCYIMYRVFPNFTIFSPFHRTYIPTS